MEGRKTQAYPMLMPEVLQQRLLPPWPVWSDSELNQEQWDPLPIWPPQSSEEIVEKPGFIHPLGSYWLPPSLSDLVADYVRPVVKGSQVLPPQEWVLPQLNERGQELVNYSPALKAIFSAITGVARLQAEPPFSLTEGVSNVFLPTAGPPWRPWHHVYSLNKAGKGAPHKPVVNPSGKYIVRLWYMGTWRSIAVDDRIPVDENGEALLLGDVTGALWAPLLTKALLCVGAVTWSAEDELRGWDPVCCLTGWLSLPLPVDCQQLQLPTVWRLCVAALAPEGTDLLIEDLRAFQEAGAEDPFGGQPPAKASPLDAVSENMGTTALVVQAEDSPGTVVVHGASVLWNAIRYRDRPPTPPWKQYRWKAWALRHGLIQERGPALYRTLRVFCPLGRLQAPPLPDMSEAEPEAAEGGGDAPRTAPGKSVRASARSTVSSPKKLKQMVQDERDSCLDLEWLACRLRGLRLLVRPSCFLSAPRLLDVPAAAMDARPGAAAGKKASVAGVYAVVPAVFPGCVYALLDSPHAKKMVLAFDAVADSVLQAWQERYTAAVGAGDVVACEGEEADAAVVVERYVWSAVAPERPLLSVAAGCCRLLSLPPGQCALRLWCSRLPRNHCLTLLAQDELFIGSREQVQDRLAVGPGSVLRAQAESVREAALWALRPEPGSPEHLPALAAFLAACSPPPPADAAPEAAHVRDYLQHALLQMARAAKPQEPSAVARLHVEMQLFFADEELRMDLLDEEEERELELLLESEPGIRDVASGSQLAPSTKVGSTGTKDTKGKAKPAKGGKKKSEYCPRYKTLAELLSPADSGVRLLRALLCGRPRLQALFPCGWDLDGLAASWDLRGVANTEGTRGWLALAQFSLNHCRAAPPNSLCALTAVVSVARWNLTVVEEATGRPVAPLVGEPQPFSLCGGGSYWALLSCWPPADCRDVFWRVRALARHKDELPHCCAFPLTGRCEPQPDPLPPRQLECGGPYLPGKEHLVCRALLFTRTLPLTVSLRLAVSNPRARFQLRVKCGDNEVLTERTCTGEVVVPLLVLEERPARSPSPRQSQQLAEPRDVKSVADSLTSKGHLQQTMFVIEAHLLRDSWPLTPEEQVGAEAAQLAARRRLLVHPQLLRQESGALSSPAPSLSLVASKSRSQRRASRRSPSRAMSASRSAASRRKLAAPSPASNASLDDALPACAPTWALAVALHADEESVELKVDDRRERWIRALKEGWEKADPGRAVRALNLRRQFQPTLPLVELLCASAKQEEKKVVEEEKVEGEMVKEEERKAEEEKVEEEEAEEEEVLLTAEAAQAEAAARRQATAEWTSLEAMFCAERALLLAEQAQRHGRLRSRHEALRDQLQAELGEVMAVRDEWVAANTPQPSGKKSKK